MAGRRPEIIFNHEGSKIKKPRKSRRLHGGMPSWLGLVDNSDRLNGNFSFRMVFLYR
jgi:hypothetical protein